MSENAYDNISETSKNIAIEIENKLTGMSVRNAIDILNAVRYSITENSTTKGFDSKKESIPVRISN